MSRPSAIFQTVFEELGMACGQYTPADMAANVPLQLELLSCFHRAYAKGYNERSWEDAWIGTTVTPVNRAVTWAQIGNARKFELWTSDPRRVEYDPRPMPVRYVTDSSGATLLTDEPTVYVLSLPPDPRFHYAAWATSTAYTLGALRVAADGHVYQCLIAHTSGNFATDLSTGKWIVVPCLQVLQEFIIEYGAGCYELNRGNAATGAARRKDALSYLDRRAQDEHFRTATHLWQPR
jgi:hypothetical protein